MTENKQRRWPLALIIIAIIIIASVGIVLGYRDSPRSIPLHAISDGSGGIIAAWQKEQGIYVQRIDASGQHLWREGGIQVTMAGAASDPYAPVRTYFSLIADGAGGAIITWDDKSKMPTDRNDPAFFNPVPFHSQRISPDGELLWKNTQPATGSAGLYGDDFPVVVADGTGGAILAWNSYTTVHKALHNDFLRLQKIAPDGARLWGDTGVLMVSSSPYRPLTDEEKAAGDSGTLTRPRPTFSGMYDIVSDSDGGVIVIWGEEGEQNSHRVYAWRLDSSGHPGWKEKTTVGDGNYSSYDSLYSDGIGGAMVMLSDRDTGSPYWQHIDSNGTLLEKRDYSPDTISDGLGGNIRVHTVGDPPTGSPYQKRSIISVQRFDAGGKALYTERQVLFTEKNHQATEVKYIADGEGGVILLWRLQKELIGYGGITAQRVDGEGNIRWGEGVAVFNKPDTYQGNATFIGDGAGGAFVIAVTGSNAFGGDMVYLQRLDADGNRLWGNGIRIDR